jgi:hypothetical protein
MREIQDKWTAFLEKLETRMEELCTVALPELSAMRNNADDPYEKNYHKVLSGVCGQLENIRKKVYDTYEEKIIGAYYQYKKYINALHPLSNQLYEFRNQCAARHEAFERSLMAWDEKLRNAGRKDLEEEYKKILEAFEAGKDRFTCKQCGSPLPIERIFFISVHIPCPACNTQNTFEPGTEARNLRFIAKDIAEQRSAAFREAYEDEHKKERELYGRIHEIKLGLIHEKEKRKAEMRAKIDVLEKERQDAIARAPELFKRYMRTVYDEMNRILPDLREHHEKMYQNAAANNTM